MIMINNDFDYNIRTIKIHSALEKHKHYPSRKEVCFQCHPLMDDNCLCV